MGAVQADQDTSFQAMHDRLAAAGRGDRQGSGRRQRHRIHRRQWRNQHREHVHRAQAAERAQDQRRPGHRAHPQGGRRTFPASICICRRFRICASAAGWRNAQYQFTLQSDDLNELNQWAPKVLKKLRTVQHSHRRQQRSAEQRARSQRRRRSRHRFAAGTLAAGDRRHAVRRVRAAAGVHDVHAAEPVPRRDGGRAAVLAEPRVARPDLRAVQHRRAGQAQHLHAFHATITTALAVNHQGQFPSVTISFNLAPGVALGDAVDAIIAGRGADQTARRHSRNLPGHRAGVPGLAQQRRRS